jgi:hypothetical protein
MKILIRHSGIWMLGRLRAASGPARRRASPNAKSEAEIRACGSFDRSTIERDHWPRSCASNGGDSACPSAVVAWRMDFEFVRRLSASRLAGAITGRWRLRQASGAAVSHWHSSVRIIATELSATR